MNDLNTRKVNKPFIFDFNDKSVRTKFQIYAKITEFCITLVKENVEERKK